MKKQDHAIGVCLGASSVSFAKATLENGKIFITDSWTYAHHGNPKKVFSEKLEDINKDNFPVIVTGRKFRNIVNLQTISEPEATEYAYEYLSNGKYEHSAIASLGGETFVVYTLEGKGKISGVITKNQCASGTGEFFMQQIKRMDLTIDEVVDMAKDARPFKVSGRCSVFCKSDCTHALNKGVRSAEVASGLSQMMADKVRELLKKVKKGKVLLVGGVTKNSAVMEFLRKSGENIDVPEEAVFFEALGAAVYGLKNETIDFQKFDNILKEQTSSFVFHKPLNDFIDRVDFKEMEKGEAADGDECILGLDVGSTTTKAVILRTKDDAVLGSIYLYTHGNPVRAARKCYNELLKQIPERIRIVGVGTTGSGRQITGLHAFTKGVVNEIIAHATAAIYFDPVVDTIFEIGGQDAKYTYIVNKVPSDYAMNEACSAGTGSFIEEAAHEAMGINVTDIEPIAMKGNKPPNFSDQCAAFINSDIKTALQEDIPREDIVAGLVYSICLNYVNRVKGNRPVGNKIFMQGGVCYNKAIPIAMAALTGQKIVVPPDPGLMGAYGVALEIKNRIEIGIMEKDDFSMKDLANREVKYEKPFICMGGKEKCDRRCEVSMINIEGNKYPFGGACNKYYNLRYKSNVKVDEFDYVKKRNDLTFKKYAPKNDLPEDAPTVGINKSFHTYTIYPFYYNFFTKLGFRIVMPETVREEGLERENASFCYPAQLSLGLFQDLVDMDPDWYFVPGIHEMYVEDKEFHRKDNNCTCAFLNTEPFYLKAAFKQDYPKLLEKMITPYINFSHGFGTQEEAFIKVAKQMGVSDVNKISVAYKYAVQVQEEYTKELFSMGEKFLKFLESNPEKFAIVLTGRPYNSFTDIANKGIPQKFASRGVYVIPYDIFDYRSKPVDDLQYWESGKKILKTAKIVKEHPQLFSTYISNFSCAPDSMIMTTFRSIMGSKPSLTLELDGHTADSGINTRIDAALDIINNYLKIRNNIIDDDGKDFLPARVEMSSTDAKYVCSDGKKVSLKDPSVKILVPSMGDLSARMFAATFRNLGFNSEALPDSNWEILKYGRAHSTGKECLPLILCIGLMVDYIENRWDGNEKIAFFIAQGAGDCRLGQYPVFMRDLIRRRKIKNVTPLALSQEEGFAGLGANFAKLAVQGLLAADVVDDVRSAILANSEDTEHGIKVLEEEFAKLVDVFEENPDHLFKQMKIMAKNIYEKVPARTKIEDSKYIALVGEMYVRRDGFAHKWLNKYFAKKGFIVKDAYITEWLFYLDYLTKRGYIQPDKSMKNKWERFIRHTFMRRYEVRMKKIMEKSGYYKFHKIDVEALLKRSEHLIPMEFRGEPGLTLGVGLHETIKEYCGVVNVGPFGCMPTRFSEAIGNQEMKVKHKIEAEQIVDPKFKLSEIFNGEMNIPFLTIESDGNVFPQIIEARLETFTLQAERMAGLMKEMNMNGGYHGK